MYFMFKFHNKLVSFKNIDIWQINSSITIKFGAYDQIWAYVF